jgi:hypothetical protein
MPPDIEYLDEQVSRAAQENPDLPVELIRDILIAQQETAVENYRLYAADGLPSASA